MVLEDAYVTFLIQNNITQAQYLLLHLVKNNRHDLIRKYKEAFPSGDNTMIGEWQINDLVKKGFLVKTENSYKLGESFLIAYINKHTATDEIYRIYPTFLEKDGIHIPLSAMDRNVFAELYDKAILSSTLEHLEVIKDIEYAKEKNLLNIGLDKFLKSKYWLTIRPKRLEHTGEDLPVLQKDNTFIAPKLEIYDEDKEE